jgi:ureidoacrylate peracid hydrolase
MGTWGANWWEEFPEFHPVGNEYVATKHRYSAFVSTDLDMVLRCTGVKTILLAGVTTDTCVESTARDAFALGYGVIILSDCTSAKDVESHEAGLKSVGRVFGVVASSLEVLSAWGEKVAP